MPSSSEPNGFARCFPSSTTIRPGFPFREDCCRSAVASPDTMRWRGALREQPTVGVVQSCGASRSDDRRPIATMRGPDSWVKVSIKQRQIARRLGGQSAKASLAAGQLLFRFRIVSGVSQCRPLAIIAWRSAEISFVSSSEMARAYKSASDRNLDDGEGALAQ